MDWKAVLKEWAGTQEHRRTVERARAVIREALRSCRRPLVAYSGGKDSSCLLHLVLEQDPDVTVLHWDYGPHYIPRCLEAEFVENARALGAKNIRVETSGEYLRLGRRAVNVLGREYLGRLLTSMRDREGYDLAFVGLRREESLKRRRRMDAGRFAAPFRESWPLADWSWKDVWAYIFARGLPYASVYDLYAPAVGWDKVRLTTFFDPEFAHLGTGNMDAALMWRFRHVPEGGD
jgi:phosphoadenosine phosphosulfate reductase